MLITSPLYDPFIYCLLSSELNVCTYGNHVFSCTVLVLYIRQISLVNVFGTVCWCKTPTISNTHVNLKY